MQTSYPARQPIGLHGGWYAAHEAPDVVSYSAEVPDTQAIKGIPFGSVVSRGTNLNDQVKLGDPDGNGFFAIAIRSVERECDPCNPIAGYADKETVSCMRTGYAYITCPEGAKAGDPVDFDDDGVIHNGGGGTVIDNAQWEFDVVAGQIGVVRVATS